MKTISEHEALAELLKMLDDSDLERVVITRNGRPRAVLVGLSDYDAEDLALANSADFWRMIDDRRSGASLPLAEVKSRLDARAENGSSPSD